MAIVKPDLPSTVVHFVGETVVSLDPSFNEVMAVIGTHSFGPLASEAGGLETYASLSEWESIYGTGDSPGRTAVVGAFSGGAGGVVFARAATAAAARATTTITNTTPAPALRLTARYAGTDGNEISYVVEDDPLDATRDRLRILFRGATVESYSYLATDIAALAAAITNRPSRYVVADGPGGAAVVTGVALTPTAGTALAAGDDGDVLTAAEYLAAQDALEFVEFGALAAAALTDAAIKVQLATWAKAQAEEMRPFRLILGGAAGESVDDAIAELAANPTLRDEHIIRFAVGTWHDSLLDLDLSTAQLASYVGGLLLARGERSALTRAEAPTLTPVGGTGPTLEELKAGRDAGLTMLRRVTSPRTQVAISEGVTTFISRSVPAKPYILFSEPRLIGLFDRILRQMVAWGDDIVVGDLPANDDTRNLVRKEMRKILDELEATGLAEPGSGFVNVDKPADPALRDTIPYSFGFVPTLTAKYLIGEGRVR